MTGIFSLDCGGKVTRGLEAVIRDVYHLLITVRGSLPAKADLGLGLADLVLSGTSTETIPAIAADIESELGKDDRVASSEAIVTTDPSGGVIIDLTVTMAAGPSFRLIGPIGSISVEVL